MPSTQSTSTPQTTSQTTSTTQTPANPQPTTADDLQIPSKPQIREQTSDTSTEQAPKRRVRLFDRFDREGKPFNPDVWEWSANVAWSILLGNLVGGLVGYRRGMQPAHDTFAMYSGAMHPEDVLLKIRKIRSNYIWMTALKYSALCGGAAGIFQDLGMRHYRQKSDFLNLSVAGLVTGSLISVPMVPKYGFLPMAMGTLIGGALGISTGLLESGSRYLFKEYGGVELDLNNNPIKKKEQPTKNEENSTNELHKT